MEEKEKFFLELIKGFQWKYDLEKYNNFLFGFKNENCLFAINSNTKLNKKKILSIIKNNNLGFKQELKNCLFWINHEKVWSIFESKFNMNYDEIQLFAKNIIEKYFRILIFKTLMMNKKLTLQVEKDIISLN